MKRLRLKKPVIVAFSFQGEILSLPLNQVTEKTIQLISADGQRFNFDRVTGRLRGTKSDGINFNDVSILNRRLSGCVLLPSYKVTELGIVFIKSKFDSL